MVSLCIADYNPEMDSCGLASEGVASLLGEKDVSVVD